MDVYWSIERCGWVPCAGPADPPGTTWLQAAQDEAVRIPDMPQQRYGEPVPAAPVPAER